MAFAAFTVGCGVSGVEDTTALGAETPTTVAVTAATTAPTATAAATQASTEEIVDSVIDEKLASLSGSPIDDLPPVAKVAGLAVTQTEFRYMLNSYKSALLLNSGIEAGADEDVNFWNRKAANGRTRLDEAREKVLSELHQMKICADIADTRGIAIDQDELENISTDLRAQEDRFGGRANFEKILMDEYGITISEYFRISESLKLRDLLLADEREEITIPDGEALSYFGENQDEYGDRIKIRQILFLSEGADVKKERSPEDTKKLAQETLEAVKGGADMALLAEGKSEEPGAALSGGEHIVTKADPYVPSEVIDWAFGAVDGDIECVETSFGFYIVRVEERIVRAFEDARPEIEETLRERILADRVAGWLKDPKYTMHIDRDVLNGIT
jgi:parvulin-like peptidyl-prolyl isomerase